MHSLNCLPKISGLGTTKACNIKIWKQTSRLKGREVDPRSHHILSLNQFSNCPTVDTSLGRFDIASMQSITTFARE